MASAVVEKLSGVRDLKRILETTVKELGETYHADLCQIMLSSPLDPNHTSICEYKVAEGVAANGASVINLPLSLQGKAFGQLSLVRKEDVKHEEVNDIRVTLGELGDIIRHAQINDIVQRDTFRETFLIEIGNVMMYSLGIGDALFMVVNILGKVLQASRCLFICTDDTAAGWKCYEFWQQDKVQSCQDYCWPTTDSPLVSQVLLTPNPIIGYEGQDNSYVTPVQEELQFIGARSFVGVPLITGGVTHGCVLVQQCDYRRAWTRAEVDMVQNVADKVADSLAKLPQEKLSREPIMQLHQRTVQVAGGEDKPSQNIQSVRNALKGALGQQAIPSARKTSQPVPAAPPPAPPPAEQAPPAPASTTAPPAAQEAQPAANNPWSGGQVGPPQPATGGGGKSLSSILGGGASGGGQSVVGFDFSPTEVVEAAPAAPGPEIPQQPPAAVVSPPAQFPAEETGGASGPWGPLDAIPTPGADGAAAPSAPVPARGDAGGKLWGNLDAIPTPSGGGITAAPAPGGGLGSMLGKAKAAASQQGSGSPLMAAFHKDKSKFTTESAPVKTEFIEGPPVEIDEEKAKAKLDEILSSSNPTSDYIFATKGVDTRMLGRIDGWVSQIESKDKYVNGHALPVAEYATAIASEMGLGDEEVNNVRLASLVHDVGKLGTAPQVLQRPEEDLEDEELFLIMKHPQDGAELLDSFPDLKHLSPIVRAHHEEFSGNGYPSGLKGDDIPVLARIIHVADSYHQMISKLKYRDAMSPTRAQQVLTEGAGTQWDPQVVEILIRCILTKKVPPAM